MLWLCSFMIDVIYYMYTYRYGSKQIAQTKSTLSFPDLFIDSSASSSRYFSDDKRLSDPHHHGKQKCIFWSSCKPDLGVWSQWWHCKHFSEMAAMDSKFWNLCRFVWLQQHKTKTWTSLALCRTRGTRHFLYFSTVSQGGGLSRPCWKLSVNH